MRSWLIALFCMLFTAVQANAAEKAGLKTEKDKVSYSIGMTVGNNLKRQLAGLDVDPDTLAKGIKDALSGAKLLMTEQEAQETITAWQQKRVQELSAKNIKEGSAFLAENKKKEGVITMPSGLQYKILTDGKGKSPRQTDTVEVNYRGTMIDGTEFDSSYKRGKPAEFQVGSVIKGWTEALQLMKEGSKWQLVIPSDLAYGERGAPGIPPNAVLIFEVELLSIKKQ